MSPLFCDRQRRRRRRTEDRIGYSRKLDVKHICNFDRNCICVFVFMYLHIRYSGTLFAPQSGAHRIAPHRDPIPYPSQSNPTYSSGAGQPWKDPWFDIFLKKKWYEDLKNNVPKYLMCKYINTNTQIHKYSLLNICYIFEKVMVRGPQKQGWGIKHHSSRCSISQMYFSKCISWNVFVKMCFLKCIS